MDRIDVNNDTPLSRNEELLFELIKRHADTWQTVEGAPPITLPNAKAQAMNEMTISGNVKRTVEIDGVSYDVPDNYVLLDKASGNKSCYATIPSLTILTTDTLYAEFTLLDNGNRMFGVNNKTRCYIASSGNGTSQFCGMLKPVPLTQWTIDGSTKNTVEMDADGITINGTYYTWESGTLGDDSLTNFTLNEINGSSSGSATSISGFELFLLKDTNGNHKNAVMFLKNSSNAIVCYDFAQKVFYTVTGTFTAGTAAPCPALPEGVVGVGEDKVNYWDKSKSTTKWINASGQEVDYPNGSAQMSDYVECSEGDTFTIRGFYNDSVSSYGQMEIAWFNSSKKFISRDSSTATTITSVTATAPANTAYCKFGVFLKDNTTVINHDSMAVKGSTAPSSYIPYGYKLPILIAENCGMVDLGTLNWTAYTSGEGYKYRTTVSDRHYGTKIEYVKGYTSDNRSAASMLDKTIIGGTSSTAIYIRDDSYTDATAFKASLSGVYLFYQRTTDTEWVAPTTYTVYTSEQLRKIGNNADTLNIIAGTGARVTGSHVVDGTENWAAYARINNCFYFGIAEAKASQGTAILCTHYESKAQGTDKGVYCGATNIGSVQCGAFYFTDTDFDNVNDFKAEAAAKYAAGNPIILYYEMITAAPVTISAQAISTAEGTNYIDVLTEVKPSNVKAVYRKKSGS